MCVGMVVAGCGSRGPVVHFVEGIVTIDGVPLGKADVGFSEETPGDGLSAVGLTREDGTFVLNAVGAWPGRGTKAGHYVVTVRKFEAKESQPPVAFEDRDRNNQPPALLPPGSKSSPFKSVIPEVYGSLETTPLRATVSNGRNSFRFELKSDIK